jgi:2-polyprenyl-3-methyl-5-hydroxy-6-metoxy-1,4-benzoquinol methylase
MELFDRQGTFGDDYLYFYEGFLGEERNKADVDRVVEVLGVVPGDRVLDAPCGHGRIANLLAERGMEVTGVDAAPEFIDLAREDATGRGVEVNYQVGWCTEMAKCGRVSTRFDSPPSLSSNTG